jgi:aminotransferase
MTGEYDRRQRMSPSPGRESVRHGRAAGRLYAFPHQPTGLTSEQFRRAARSSNKVAVIPGNAFGPSGEGTSEQRWRRAEDLQKRWSASAASSTRSG